MNVAQPDFLLDAVQLSARYADDWASGAFVTELPDAFFDVPLLWVHGHTHQQFDYRVRSCRIVCNPRGYLNWSGKIENNAFDPALVIDVPTCKRERRLKLSV